jgi:hypothetical protein
MRYRLVGIGVGGLLMVSACAHDLQAPPTPEDMAFVEASRVEETGPEADFQVPEMPHLSPFPPEYRPPPPVPPPEAAEVKADEKP